MTTSTAAQAAATMLASVIGGLLEDHAHEAISASARDLGQLACRLERLGGDVSALAEAMLVLLRQDEP